MFCPKCNNAYDISNKIIQQTGGSEIMSTIISILDNILSNDEYKKLDTAAIYDSPEYKNLTDEDKEMLKVNIKEHTTDINKVDLTGTTNYKAYFTCKVCHNHEEIKSGTLLFTMNSNIILQEYKTKNYKNMIHSDITHHTREYICPNEECLTHTQPETRDAMFFRYNNSYTIAHICTVCETCF